MSRGTPLLVLSISSVLAAAALAQEPALPEAAATPGAIPLAYVGSNGRVAVSIDDSGGFGGELLGVFGDVEQSAFIAQAWFDADAAGGLQFDYHWLAGARTDAAANVVKLFGALDQSREDDRKATLGIGIERATLALDLYYAHAISGERLISQRRGSSTETVSVTIDGRPFRQDVTTDTLTQIFEHPYEHGIGLRVSRFFEPALFRLRAGLDYERGEALLQHDSADQLSFAAGVEKYFSGTGHSVALEIEHFRKQGPFDVGAFGGERDGTRALLSWRYELGRSFRPAKSYRKREIRSERREEPPAPKVVRHEVQLSGQTLFELDRAVLTEGGKAELRTLLERLKHRRIGQVEIVGHTCDLGSEPYNQALSERRAAAVRDWLVAEGVDPLALTASGEGERHPRHPNDSEHNRARNRRIELRFTSFEETVVAAEPSSATITEWVQEEIPQPPAWIERALRTPAFHKRAVDTYRIQRVTESRTEGPLVPVNQAPGLVDDTAQTTQGVAIDIDVLANDSDPDGDRAALTISAVTDPPRGVVSVSAEGTITYTPDTDFVGVDSFTYTVQDGAGGTATATVTVSVMPAAPNSSPIARNDSVATQPEVAVAVDVLANDSDPDGDAMSIVSVTQGANGNVAISGNGLTYAPNTGFVGDDSFTYTIADAHGLTATATVNVTVQASNQAPNAVDDSAHVQDQFVTIPVLGNDSDPDGDQIFVASVGTPTLGSVQLNSDGTITYTRISLLDGTDTFVYTVSDDKGATSTATVTVTLEGVD